MNKLTVDELDRIIGWLKENVFRNENYMFLPYHTSNDEDGELTDNLLSMVASLANLLFKEVRNEKYDYFFHWANKVGAWVEDNVFDDIIKGGNDLKFYE